MGARRLGCSFPRPRGNPGPMKHSEDSMSAARATDWRRGRSQRRPRGWRAPRLGNLKLLRQQLLDLDRNLSRLNLDALAAEVDVVAVVFGMGTHRRVEIVNWNFLRGHDFRSQGIASRNPFV